MERLLDIDRMTRSQSVQTRAEAYGMLFEHAKDVADGGVRGSAVLRAVDCFCAPCAGLDEGHAGEASRHALRTAMLAAAQAAIHARGRIDYAHADEAVARLAALAESEPGVAPSVLGMLAGLVPILTLSPSSEAVLVYLAQRYMQSEIDAVFGAAAALSAALGPHPVTTAVALAHLANPVRRPIALSVLPAYLCSRLL